MSNPIPIESIDQLAGIAEDLANGEFFAVAPSLTTPTFNLEKVVHRLMRFFLAVTGADVAFVRRLEGNSDVARLFFEVDKDSWREGFIPIGTPPKEKHTGDGPCRPDRAGNPRTDGGNRTNGFNESAFKRKKLDGSDFYTDEEKMFLQWIQSEAWIVIKVNGIPKALICVCSGKLGHFTEVKIKELRRYEAFVSAFYRLAELADERRSKVDLVAKICRVVLPLLAKNSTLRGFQRAILTLLTCEHGGFGFDRALLFWMENHQLPASCNMAVGGMSENWKIPQEQIRAGFHTLAQYMENSLLFPEPGSSGGTPDPLYEAVKDNPLYYRPGDGGMIQQFLDGRVPDVPKLSGNDPWIRRIRQERPGIFVSPHQEYFMFPLFAPFGAANGEPQLFGFVIADSAYGTLPHEPDHGPDLLMALHLLGVVSSVWAAREEAENHFNVVSSLDVLRHNAPAVEKFIDRLEDLCKKPEPDVVKIKEVAQQTIENAIKLTRAIDVLVDTRTKRLSQATINPEFFIGAVFQERVNAHEGKLLFEGVEDLANNPPLLMPRRVLQSILIVLANNAVSSAQDAKMASVEIRVRLEPFEPPMARGRSNAFVKIRVSNNGPPIRPDLMKYLFVPGVSTHQSGPIPHRGSGLATAQAQAQAYGGDLILGSASPVEFELLVLVQPQRIQTSRG